LQFERLKDSDQLVEAATALFMFERREKQNR
jgi:hypothetical protein